MPSRRFGSPLFFVRWQNPLFLDGYPSLDPLISWTIPIIVPLIVRKISRVSDTIKVSKTKNWWLQIFKFFANAKLYFSSYCEQGLRKISKKKSFYLSDDCKQTVSFYRTWRLDIFRRQGEEPWFHFPNRAYQIWHFLMGFILVPGRQLKASANGGKLITVPRTL